MVRHRACWCSVCSSRYTRILLKLGFVFCGGLIFVGIRRTDADVSGLFHAVSCQSSSSHGMSSSDPVTETTFAPHNDSLPPDSQLPLSRTPPTSSQPTGTQKLHTCAALNAAYAPAESQPSGQTPVYRHLCCRRVRRCCALGSFTRPGQRWRGTSAPCPCPRLWHHSVGIRDRNRGVQTLGPEFFVCFSSLSAGAAELTCRIHGAGIARGLIYPSWRRTEGVSGARRSVCMAGCRLPATWAEVSCVCICFDDVLVHKRVFVLHLAMRLVD